MHAFTGSSVIFLNPFFFYSAVSELFAINYCNIYIHIIIRTANVYTLLIYIKLNNYLRQFIKLLLILMTNRDCAKLQQNEFFTSLIQNICEQNLYLNETVKFN